MTVERNISLQNWEMHGGRSYSWELRSQITSSMLGDSLFFFLSRWRHAHLCTDGRRVETDAHLYVGGRRMETDGHLCADTERWVQMHICVLVAEGWRQMHICMLMAEEWRQMHICVLIKEERRQMHICVLMAEGTGVFCQKAYKNIHSFWPSKLIFKIHPSNNI